MVQKVKDVVIVEYEFPQCKHKENDQMFDLVHEAPHKSNSYNFFFFSFVFIVSQPPHLISHRTNLQRRKRVGSMEISLVKALLNKIIAFSSLASSDELDPELASQYAHTIDEILKPLRHVFEVFADSGVAADKLLIKSLENLVQLINQVQPLLETWHPLQSKLYFVLQVEPLISEIRMSTLEIFKMLEPFDELLPAELKASVLENSIQEVKHRELDDTATCIKQLLDHAVTAGDELNSMAKIVDRLNLKSNQLLLIEAVALEKLKEDAEQAETNDQVEQIEQIVALVTQMHNELTTKKQSESCSPVSIPLDFCCPLSLELMTDPVIVASGQTYERAYIKAWIDTGLNVCPKTRKTLAHTNLIPNFTVKALIANWCESNKVKLPDPMRSPSSAYSSPLHTRAESGVSRNSHILNHARENDPMARDLTRSVVSAGHNMTSVIGTQQDETYARHPRSSSEGSLPSVVEKESRSHNGTQSVLASEDGLLNSVQEHVASACSSWSPSKEEVPDVISDRHTSRNHNRVASDSSKALYANMSINSPGTATVSASHQSSPYNSDNMGEVPGERPASGTATNAQRETGYSPRFETRSRSQTIWRRPSERFVPRLGATPVDNKPDMSGIEAEVKKLVEDLKSDSIENKKRATSELRQLTKHSMDNRIVIANCGAISLLVELLHSPDLEMQEDAVTALLNLSINDNNKTAIANADAIGPLIHVLQTGNPDAKSNSAATLFSLSVTEENKIKIGRSGAIVPLVELLGNGTPRGKKDAATALFNLSIYNENKARIVAAGAVRHLVELMDPAAGMVDKAVAVLANLSTIAEGRTAIGQERGIPVLVEVVELGSARGKENAAAALLQLCTNSNRFCSLVLQEGAVPPLVALSQSGTPRAKEKAQALLSHFRNQRHGTAGRG
uniref:RING-type E3 ubiquitin transferase n=2 Tax=Kalanchoe fedtschenkoi TaxID=63787 RepID=A0A7N0USI9_KALFE